MKHYLLLLLFFVQLLTFGQTLNIGDSYQGGLVAYLDPSGAFGFIVTPSGQSSGTSWGCYGSSIPGANSTSIDAGGGNTSTIVSSCSDAGIAAKVCANLSLGGYSDWFLPSKNELSLLYQNKTVLGGFANAWYWSSSQDINNPFNAAWAIDFTDGTTSAWNKGSSFKVRAIRRFVPPPTSNGPLTFCQGQSVTLTAPNGVSWNWNTGANSQSITVTASGNYYVTVDNGSTTFTTSESVVTTLASPSISNQPTDQFVGETQTASFFLYSPDNPLTYQWQTDVGLGFQNLNDAGQYSGTSTNNLSVSNCTPANNDNQAFRCIIDNGSCKDTSDIVFLNVSGLGLEEMGVEQLILYPNPSKEELRITNIESTEKINSVEIISLEGRITKVPIKSFPLVNVEQFPSGLYTIQVRTDNKVFTSRFVKL